MALVDLDLGVTTTVVCPDITITDVTVYDGNAEELQPNGDFSSTYGGFVPYWADGDTLQPIDDNIVNEQYTFATNAILQTGIILTVGHTYRVSFDYVSKVNMDDVISIKYGTGLLIDTTSGLGAHSTTFAAESTILRLQATSLGDVIDNVSIIDITNPVSRNISILLPDNTYAPLADKQTYTLELTESTFLDNSQVGQIITFTICGEDVTFTVPVINGHNDFECMLKDIVTLLASTTTDEYPNFSYSLAGDIITLEYKEPGIPIAVTVDYSLGNSTTYYTLTNTATGSPTLGLSTDPTDYLTYTPIARGGKYTITLSDWDTDPCDRVTNVSYVWNWCFDYKELNECFMALVRDQECGCNACKEE